MDKLLTNSDTSQLVLSFLTPKDTRQLAQVNKAARGQVEKNKCQILSHFVYALDYKGRGCRYENCEYTTTKENALAILEKYKKDEKVFWAQIYHYEQELGWIANSPTWTLEWNRPDFFKGVLWFFTTFRKSYTDLFNQ